MVKPKKFDHFNLVYHFTVPLRENVLSFSLVFIFHKIPLDFYIKSNYLLIWNFFSSGAGQHLICNFLSVVNWKHSRKIYHT